MQRRERGAEAHAVVAAELFVAEGETDFLSSRAEFEVEILRGVVERA
jgi:hypothetical protein